MGYPRNCCTTYTAISPVCQHAMFYYITHCVVPIGRMQKCKTASLHSRNVTFHIIIRRSRMRKNHRNFVGYLAIVALSRYTAILFVCRRARWFITLCIVKNVIPFGRMCKSATRVKSAPTNAARSTRQTVCCGEIEPAR